MQLELINTTPQEIVSLPTVDIWTDGACEPNPGRGGWAAIVLVAGKDPFEISGAVEATTNNAMEMMAAIKGLESLSTRSLVTVWTDSEYLRNGASEWMKNWKRNQWCHGNKPIHPVKNAELWKRIDALCQQHVVMWRWIRGHSWNRLNERCDALAVAAIKFPLAEG